ncbi:MAG: hypothetical protein IJU23_14065 [Proteobacteria bacterium]|nr:hypothetical protein [Pseudomonadota bacterium]
MNENLRRRLALACCAAMALAASACSGDSAGSSVVEMCGDTVCLDTEICEEGVCKPKDPCSLCTETQDCVNGTCKDKEVDPCSLCTANQKCVDKVCTDLCGAAICGSTQKCINQQCVNLCNGEPCEQPDPCANKTCPDNWRCDPNKNGACVEIDPCETATCLTAQTCLNGRCYDDECLDTDGDGNVLEKRCEEGQECSKGKCIDSLCKTLKEPCADGWQCIKGICEETACINYHCEDGRSCRGEKCVDNECLDMRCDDDKVCSKGNCLYPACLDKAACTTGKTCNAEGNCVYIAAPAISLDVPEDKTTDEKGKSLSLALHLNNAPGNDVRVSCEILTTSTNKEVEVSCDEIVFNADNWQLEQTIKVTGVDDYLIDGDQTYTIKVTTASEDKDFDALVTESVVLTNLDMTKPGFAFSETSLMTYEDQTADPATFTVTLTSLPSADVSLKIHSSKETEGTVSPTSLTFTKDNWNKPQTVTVTGVDDEEHDGNVNYTVYFEPSESEDEAYQGVQAQPIKVTNVDNDKAGISMNLANEGFDLNEGQQYPLTIKLNTKPKKDVKIALAADDATEAEFDVAEFTVKIDDWNKGTEVQLIGVADHIIDGDQPVKLTFTTTSEDSDYNFKADYTGTVKDIDTAELVVSTSDSPIVKEGSDDAVTLSLSLTSKPTADVKVDIAIGDDTEIKTDKTSITIAPDNWNVLQDLKVSSVDDDIIDGSIKSNVTLKLTSEDTHFAGLSKDVEFTTLDDDEAGFIVTSTPGSYAENSSATSSMTVALTAQPDKDVTVTVSSSDATELAVTSDSTLTFTKENWKTPQTVTVIVVDDNVADGQQTAYVMFAGSSSDPHFNDIKDQSANFTIIDNESATVALAVNPTTIDPASTITIATLSLGAEPLTDVTLTPMAEHSDIVTFDPPTVTFTKSNWSTPQNVTVNVNLNNVSSTYSVENIWATASGDVMYSGIESKHVALALYKIPRVQNFEYTGSIETVSLPVGTYRLETWGAQGGDVGPVIGYTGAYSVSYITLETARTLKILVGQRGGLGAGGGGSFITYDDNEPICIAGGGGGAGGPTVEANNHNIPHDNNYGQSLQNGGSTYSDNGGGTSGSGGKNGNTNGPAPGGGGLLSNGDSGGGALGGRAFINGGAGGTGSGTNYISTPPGNGGFGGGGGGWNNNTSGYVRGGGGGGYSGGQGGTYSSTPIQNCSGGGGGSYHTGTSSNSIIGNASMPAPLGSTETGHVGNGYVRITLQ